MHFVAGAMNIIFFDASSNHSQSVCLSWLAKIEYDFKEIR